MNKEIVKFVLGKKTVSVSEIIKATGKATHTVYSTLRELENVSAVEKSKGLVKVIDAAPTNFLKKMIVEGFDLSIISKKNLVLLKALLQKRALSELINVTSFSQAQVYRYIQKLKPFIVCAGNSCELNKNFPELIEFINSLKKYDVYWTNGKEELIKTLKEDELNGTKTAFSTFSDHNLVVFPSHNYFVFPRKKLSIEEILIHAIKFSQNKNELALCILFYLKNKKEMNILLIESLAKKFGVIDLWLDMISFLEGGEIKNKTFFLKPSEFYEKASLYKIKFRIKYEKDVVDFVFEGLSKKIGNKIDVFVLGGIILMEYGLKTATKDLDLMVKTMEEFIELKKAFEKMGYNETIKREKQYEQLKPSTILDKQNQPRIDLFTKKICDALELSAGMISRAKKTEIRKLCIWFLSLEDIFLFKSISSRDSDITDCQNILEKKKIDWNIVWKELLNQRKNLKALSCLTILDHLEVLEQRIQAKIPITKKVLSLCIKESILFITAQPKTVKEIKSLIEFPEYLIRNQLNKLIKEKKIRKIQGKPIKFAKT